MAGGEAFELPVRFLNPRFRGPNSPRISLVEYTAGRELGSAITVKQIRDKKSDCNSHIRSLSEKSWVHAEDTLAVRLRAHML